ncbi:GDNF/GAS1 domain-containing protein [Caenorhabditis elegans]|uniref:GDNF/GAS1 domain-containing protein n=1 Tax=Caenorhabditis elegans TaxID=6239 RepID=Q95XG5_CAEEL|nr:GDNF/GAS1 domain-containing protein [Caenorhabditis elegans]CCD74142.1 GDNF/GAS1 domain-containing protein [Caenorhabditis elegans]|eukprot:NP_500240.2 Uncharacterized protein CELE_Y69A2AR.31 [Caenorhabditis elegans]
MSPWLLILLLYSLFESSASYDSCLHYRSICLRNDTCNQHLKRFQTTCGYDLNVCSGTSPSDCVYYLHRIREIFPTKSCTCYEAIGFSQECDFFRQIIWNHSCERKMRDVGEEIKLNNRKILRIETNRMQNVQKHPETSLRRTTRTPVADQIHQWKTQLSGELTKSKIEQKTCDAALYQVCLKHVSCSQLWSMFRKNCDVDLDNQCRMADREVCWQSFEGLTWSGLGDCQCASSNSSDCHWIRLHTNYNKCIYEISKSGQFPVLMTLAQKNREAEENKQRAMSEQYRRRYENREQSEYILREVPTTTTTTTTTTVPPTTTRTTTTTTPRPTVPTVPRTTTVPSWWSSAQAPRHRDTSPRQGFRLKAVIDPTPTVAQENYYTYQGSKMEFPPAFRPRKSSLRSSCPDAIRRCESVDECRWHLGELRVRCASTASCQREECAQSLQRFVTYVPFALIESIMFCHCAPEDEGCLTQQEIIYPKCLYRSSGYMQTCTQSVQKCDQDQRCKHIRYAMQAHCPVRNGECSKTSLDDCRRTLLTARASILEQPCFCKLSDVQCLAHQNSMIPTNPCIESAMIEYSRIMGYSKPGLATNRVQSTVEEAVDPPEPEPAMRRTASTINHQPITTVTFAPPTYQEPPRTTSRPYQNQQNNRKRMRTSTTTKAPRTTVPPTTVTVRTTKTTTTTTTPPPPPPVTSKKSSFLDLFGIFGKKETQTTVADRKSINSETIDNLPTDDENNEEQMDEEPMTEIKKSSDTVQRKPKFRTTVTPPITSEAPPPWISTTPTAPTTTTVFTTHAPPPMEGCNTKDANGREIFTHIGAIMRKYVDWSGRCSTWCECESEDHLACEPVPCLDHGTCDAPLTTIEFGERVFLKDRGACYCETGNFVCEFPEDSPETYPGLYMSIGYSQKDVELIRKAVPREILDKAGFSSSDASTDIASRMQIAFERLLPKNLQCRIVTMNELSEPGNALYRIEWYGRNEMFNHTRTRWHSDGAEKICSPYVRKLADHFSLNESPRFQLVLSTVKQVKVLDYLDGLPQSSSGRHFTGCLLSMYYLHLLIITLLIDFITFP